MKKKTKLKPKAKRSKPPATAPQKPKFGKRKRTPKPKQIPGATVRAASKAAAAAAPVPVTLRDGAKLSRRRGKVMVEIVVGKSMCQRNKHKLTTETIYIHPKRGTLQCKRCKVEDSKVWMRNKRAGKPTNAKRKQSAQAAVKPPAPKTRAAKRKAEARRAIRATRSAGPKGGGPPKRASAASPKAAVAAPPVAALVAMTEGGGVVPNVVDAEVPLAAS